MHRRPSGRASGPDGAPHRGRCVGSIYSRDLGSRSIRGLSGSTAGLADLEWLRGQGAAVERFNLSQEPGAFGGQQAFAAGAAGLCTTMPASAARVSRAG